MRTKLVPVASVIPYARNPRRNEGAVAKVAASIQEFGFRQPIVVDPDMVVLAGHTRLEAARVLSLPKVPVHVAEGLSAAQRRAYRLADNRTHEDAEWDRDLLALEFADLDAADFDVSLTGFEADEIVALQQRSEGLTDPDAVPEPPAEAVTKLGDVWRLGAHRLCCGDATAAADVERLLDGVKPMLMVTDPPYGVDYDAKWRAVVNNDGPDSKRAVGAVKNDHTADWTPAWQLFPGDVAYVWHGALQADVVAANLVAAGFNIRSQIVWVKQQIVFGRGDYHWQHEPCWYVVRKNAKGNWSGDRKQSTVWEIRNTLHDHDDKKTNHSTQKPVECMRRPVLNNSSPGQALYDPFVGSGTTIIAAEMEARACYAMELDPIYCDMAVKRWEEFTGQTAERDEKRTKTNANKRGKAPRKSRKAAGAASGAQA